MTALALLLAATALASEPAALFDSHGCRACHKVGHRGGNAGPDLTMVGHRRPQAWIDKWLASPRHYKPDTRMPEQRLAAADRAALAAWLSRQKGRAWEAVEPWDAETDPLDKGWVIYGRAGCVACHGPAGRGGHPNPGAHGGVIPALAPLMSTYTAPELKAKLKKGVVPEVHDGPPAEVTMPGWEGVLDEGELDALVAYLLSLAGDQPKGEW
ncbi:MAG: cytochrome c [Elusimicrobiota bacterium]|nr:cytochrome c [Elusimicrobiota bacterium]